MDLMDHDRIVINQKAKLIEMTNEYLIRDTEGADIGVIRQEGQTTLKKIARFVSSLDQYMTHALSVYQADGAKVLEVVRPRKIMKSTIEVADGTADPTNPPKLWATRCTDSRSRKSRSRSRSSAMMPAEYPRGGIPLRP